MRQGGAWAGPSPLVQPPGCKCGWHRGWTARFSWVNNRLTHLEICLCLEQRGGREGREGEEEEQEGRRGQGRGGAPA